MHQLKLPQSDAETSLQSSTEEMRTISSQSSSIKEQQKPEETSIDPVVKKVEEMVVLAPSGTGETTPRLPFQLLQHHR